MSKEVAPGIFLHTCIRCKNVWVSRSEIPKTCASSTCRSPYWNKPIVRKSVSRDRKKK